MVGQTYAEARTLLGQLGLRIRNVTVDPVSPMPLNTVVAQTPAAGRAVEGGTGVDLIIAGRTPQ